MIVHWYPLESSIMNTLFAMIFFFFFFNVLFQSRNHAHSQDVVQLPSYIAKVDRCDFSSYFVGFFCDLNALPSCLFISTWLDLLDSYSSCVCVIYEVGAQKQSLFHPWYVVFVLFFYFLCFIHVTPFVITINCKIIYIKLLQ